MDIVTSITYQQATFTNVNKEGKKTQRTSCQEKITSLLDGKVIILERFFE